MTHYDKHEHEDEEGPQVEPEEENGPDDNSNDEPEEENGPGVGVV